MPGVLFDRESSSQIAETVRRSRPTRHIGRAIVVPAHAYRPPIIGVLLDDLEAATDEFTGATTARGAVFAPDLAHPAENTTPYTPAQLKFAQRTENIVNRDLDASATAGTLFKATWVNAEWLIDWLACSAGSHTDPASELDDLDNIFGDEGYGG